MKQLNWILAAFLAIMFTACTSSSKVTTSWKAPDATKDLSAYKNVLVVGLQGTQTNENRLLKEEMETYMVQYLQQRNVKAIASHEAFGPKVFSGMSEDQITDAVHSKGYDGIITIALIDRQKQENYVPGNLGYAPVGLYPFYGRFGLYYSTMYSRLYTPGYYTTSTNYYWETNLFDARKDKLIYSAQSAIFDPTNATNMGQQNGKVIVEDLQKQGLIARR
jgi:hypothetical protein